MVVAFAVSFTWLAEDQSTPARPDNAPLFLPM